MEKLAAAMKYLLVFFLEDTGPEIFLMRCRILFYRASFIRPRHDQNLCIRFLQHIHGIVPDTSSDCNKKS